MEPQKLSSTKFSIILFAVSYFLFNFAADSNSPKGQEGQILVVKGRLRTLSSVCESRKFIVQEGTQQERPLRVYCTLFMLLWTPSIYLGVGYRVAYPEARQCESPDVG